MKNTLLVATLIFIGIACEQDSKPRSSGGATPAPEAPVGDVGDLDQEADPGNGAPIQGCGSNEGATFNGLTCEEAKQAYDKSVVDCIESGYYFDIMQNECSDVKLSSEECTQEAIKEKYKDQPSSLSTFESLVANDHIVLGCIDRDDGAGEYFIYSAARSTANGDIEYGMQCAILNSDQHSAECMKKED